MRRPGLGPTANFWVQMTCETPLSSAAHCISNHQKWELAKRLLGDGPATESDVRDAVRRSFGVCQSPCRAVGTGPANHLRSQDLRRSVWHKERVARRLREVAPA